MLDLIKRGCAAGLAAGIAVAAGVLVYDLFRLAPLSTPEGLARSLMGGPVVTTTDLGAFAWIAGSLERGAGLIGYSLAHLSIFMSLGVAGAWAFEGGKVPGNILTGAAFGAVAGTAVFYLGFGLLAPSFVDIPSWGLVLAMNAIAGVVLVAMLVDDGQTSSEAVSR